MLTAGLPPAPSFQWDMWDSEDKMECSGYTDGRPPPAPSSQQKETQDSVASIMRVVTSSKCSWLCSRALKELLWA